MKKKKKIIENSRYQIFHLHLSYNLSLNAASLNADIVSS